MLLTTSLIAVAVLVVLLVVRRFGSPACPRCGARDWDRELCRPLLLCRRCATRCDSRMQCHN